MELAPFLLSLLLFSFFTSKVVAVKCFTCDFTINRCTDLNCYNAPDNCSPRFFTAAVVPYRECPAGCEIYSMSDPNGIILEWRRDCDLSGNTQGQEIDFTNKCKTEYLYGTRMDKCFCNQDFCNSSTHIKPGLVVLPFFMALYLAFCHF